jgi:hypothetical protein
MNLRQEHGTSPPNNNSAPPMSSGALRTTCAGQNEMPAPIMMIASVPPSSDAVM